MAKKNYRIYRTVLICAHIFLVLAVLSSGSLAGLYYSQPFIHVRLKQPHHYINVWHMKPGPNSSVLAGGSFTTTLALYNTSIFPITIEPQQVELHYYPIGERPSCLFLHSDDQHFDANRETKNILKVHKTVDPVTESFFKLNDLKVSGTTQMQVSLKSSRWDFKNPKYYDLKWKMGFEVPYDRLDTMKQLYMDCVKFDTVLFSIHLKENQLGYLFMRKKLKSTFEVLVPMSCSIGSDVHKLFYNHTTKPVPVLFEGLQNAPMTFDYYI